MCIRITAEDGRSELMNGVCSARFVAFVGTVLEIFMTLGLFQYRIANAKLEKCGKDKKQGVLIGHGYRLVFDVYTLLFLILTLKLLRYLKIDSLECQTIAIQTTRIQTDLLARMMRLLLQIRVKMYNYISIHPTLANSKLLSDHGPASFLL
ncbi:unnamed protein product [Periconia digitata]|uniref:Uncharacterized protein n=1 Tax=Periconia digitata TaxID=1303443 RepID=A0A9W4UFU8_9PLEO|nr:unnamed protein product [Periconia digitata]